MAYKCYFCGEEMPQTPDKLTLKINGKNKTVSLLSGSEINILKAPGLTDISVTLVFPMFTAQNAPDYYLSLMESFITERKPTYFKVTRESPDGRRLLFNTDFKVSIENYKISEEAKSGFDVSVEVSMKQYRDYGTTKITVDYGNTAVITKEREKDNAPGNGGKSDMTYTVQKGDTLWSIARKFYGDGSKCYAIYNANTDVIKNPNLIYAGTVITIPKSTANNTYTQTYANTTQSSVAKSSAKSSQNARFDWIKGSTRNRPFGGMPIGAVKKS